MLIPDYEYQYNEGLYQNVLMQRALKQYIPTVTGVFKQSLSYALQDNSLTHLHNTLQ